MCNTCIHCIYDGSTDAYECKKWDEMTAEDVEAYSNDGGEGCSQYEEDPEWKCEGEFFG